MITVTLIFCPVLLDLIKVAVVELTPQRLWVLVVEDPLAIELVVFPLALVGKFIGLIVEFAVAGHPVFLPVAFIHPTVLVVKSAEAVFESSNFVALVSAALGVDLVDELCLLLQVTMFLLVWGGMGDDVFMV